MQIDLANIRPVIFDYGEIHEYVTDMLEWRRRNFPEFSVRQVTKSLVGCSPTLVTQVSKGQRDLTRERIDEFAVVLNLSPQEKAYLEQWVVRQKRDLLQRKNNRRGQYVTGVDRVPARKREAANHLLTDWVNVYVKDACRLRAFEPNPKVIHRILGGIVPLKRIRRSLNFLFKEGFLRKTLDGKIVESTPVTATTDDIPDQKLRIFHKRALDIAKRGIDLFPLSERRAAAVVLPVDQNTLPLLRDLLRDFHERMTRFAEEHTTDSERLYQVLINLTPIGGKITISDFEETDE